MEGPLAQRVLHEDVRVSLQRVPHTNRDIDEGTSHRWTSLTWKGAQQKGSLTQMDLTDGESLRETGFSHKWGEELLTDPDPDGP